jgi:hypothetical protein
MYDSHRVSLARGILASAMLLALPLQAAVPPFVPKLAIDQQGGGLTPVSTALGDIDGDGDIDLVVANSAPAPLTALINDGAGRYVQRIVDPRSLKYLAVALADMDGDGDSDVSAIACNTECRLFSYRWHDGSAEPGVIEHLIGMSRSDGVIAFAFTTAPMEPLLAVDFDRNGVMDLVAARPGGTGVDVYLARRPTTPGEQLAYVKTALADIGGKITAADFNGDGRLEIGLFDPTTTTFLSFGWNGTAPEPVILNVELLHRPTDMESADFDGDGDVDLLYVADVGTGSGVVLARNGGAGSFTSELIYQDGGNPSQALSVRDMSGDGVLDLLIAQDGFTNTDGSRGRLLVLENTTTTGGAPTFVEGRQFSQGGARAADLDVVETDGDGDLDVVVTWPRADRDRVVVFENIQRDAFPAIAAQSTGDVASPSLAADAILGDGVQAVDLDGDGDLDGLTTVTSTSPPMGTQVTVLENLDASTGGWSTRFIRDSANRWTPTASDLNGDLLPDIVMVNGDNAPIKFILNQGGLTFAGIGTALGDLPAGIVGPVSALAILDVDQDGDKDIAYTAPNTTGRHELRLLRNSGEELFTPDATSMGNFSLVKDLIPADMDNDGNQEIVLSGNAFAIIVETDDGSQNIAFTDATNPPTPSRIDVADLDLDGRLDIVLASAGDKHRVQWLRNVPSTPTPTFENRVVSSVAFAVSRIRAADIDGDGDIDVATAQSDVPTATAADALAVYNGRGFHAGSKPFTRRFTRGLLGNVAAEPGDFDRDGDLDFFVTNGTDVEVISNDTIHRGLVFSPQVVAGPPAATGSGAAVDASAMADLDGDGRDELIAAADEGTISRYEPVDTLGTYRKVDEVTSRPVLRFGEKVDLLGTSRKGLLIADSGSSHTTLRALTVPSGNLTVASLSAVQGRQFAVARLNDNTRQEFIGWDENGDIHVAFDNIAPVVIANVPQEPNDRTLLTGDFDEDGDVDLMAVGLANGVGSATLVRNPGNAAMPPWSTVNAWTSSFAEGFGKDVVQGDVDNDGDIDVAGLLSQANVIAILRNNGTGVFTTFDNIDVPREFHLTALQFQDLDDDGDLDLYLGAVPGVPIEHRFYMQEGVGRWSERTLVPPAPHHFGLPQSAARLVDVNQDGRRDLLGVNSDTMQTVAAIQCGGQLEIQAWSAFAGDVAKLAGTAAALLEIVVKQGATASRGDARIDALPIQLLHARENIPPTLRPLTEGEAAQLFDSLDLWLDGGDGIDPYATAPRDDTFVAGLGDGAIALAGPEDPTPGTVRLDLRQVDEALRLIHAGQPRRYWVTGTLKDTSSLGDIAFRHDIGVVVQAGTWPPLHASDPASGATVSSCGAQRTLTGILEPRSPHVFLATPDNDLLEGSDTALVVATTELPVKDEVAVPLSLGANSTADQTDVGTLTTLIIPAGSTSGSAAIAITDDHVAEPSENLDIRIDSALLPRVLEHVGSPVRFTLQDDDRLGLVADDAENLATTERGGAIDINVRLRSLPEGDVEMPVSISNDEASATPRRLVFTRDNWDTPQQLTLTGNDDFESDGAVPFEVVLGPIAVPIEVADHPLKYAGKQFSLSAVNLDDETGGGIVAGTLFDDTNSNGLRESGESGAENVTVWADINGDDTVQAGEPETTTSASGEFSFRFEQDTTLTLRIISSNRILTHAPPQITVQRAEIFGALLGNALIGGRGTGLVYADLNANNEKEGGESGVPDVIVFNDANGNSQRDAAEHLTQTGPDGVYQLLRVDDGVLRPFIQVPVGFIPTSPLPPSTPVSGGQQVEFQGFGIQQTSIAGGEVHSVLFLDNNLNGTKEGDEAGVPSVTIYDDANRNDSLDPGENAVRSDPDGRWSLSRTTDGSITPRVVLPPKFVQTTPPTLTFSPRFGNSITIPDIGIAEVGDRVFCHGFGEDGSFCPH